MIVGLLLALAACGGAPLLPETTASRPCLPGLIEDLAYGSECDWRALNASRAPGSLVGFYTSLDADFDGYLVVLERGDGAIVAAMSGHSRYTSHGCSAAMQGVAAGGRAELTPLPGWAREGDEDCDAEISATGRDEIWFATKSHCASYCGARVLPTGGYRLRRRE